MPPVPTPIQLTAEAEPGYPRLWHFTVANVSGAFAVDYGDGVTENFAGGTTSFDHVFQDAGSYTVTVTSGGQSPASVDVDVQASALIVTPDELQALLGIDAENATRVSALVQLAIEAYLWPNPVPDPVPPPMHAVGLALAARFAGASLTRSGAVVSESLGSYSYRLASPLTFDSVVLVLGELAEALAPWASFGTAFDVRTPSAMPGVLPFDYFQRNLDNALKAFDQSLEEAAAR